MNMETLSRVTMYATWLEGHAYTIRRLIEDNDTSEAHDATIEAHADASAAHALIMSLPDVTPDMINAAHGAKFTAAEMLHPWVADRRYLAQRLVMYATDLRGSLEPVVAQSA